MKGLSFGENANQLYAGQGLKGHTAYDFAAIGAAGEPPREVYSYVEQNDMPSVVYQERIVVGEPLAESVVVRRVPQHDEWGYAVVNNRVIVDNRSRKAVKVIESR